MKNIVVLSGAGISAESGISTFRDSNGLWENHEIVEVASQKGWDISPTLVNDFYNIRRINVINSQPNDAHKILVDLEKDYNVEIFTQNIDDLHERAGSKSVTHFHGEILKAITSDPHGDITKKYPVGMEGLNEYRNLDENDKPLRPDVVWFGEQVRNYNKAKKAIESCDIFIVIGTSFVVFPVNELISFAPPESYNINPDPNCDVNGFININEKASIGMEILQLDYL